MLLLWCGGAMGGSSADEFPLLSALGLYAADIRGDGKLLQLSTIVIRIARTFEVFCLAVCPNS